MNDMGVGRGGLGVWDGNVKLGCDDGCTAIHIKNLLSFFFKRSMIQSSFKEFTVITSKECFKWLYI